MAQLERLGKYQITEVIGRGAMGVVYKAFDPNIRRTVAIKTIRLDAVEEGRAGAMLARFRNEAQAAGRLSHPGIVAIYDYGEESGLAHIAMEYIEGNSLREYLSRGTRFGERDVVSIMAQLLEALAYAHEQGVWHRDIKPANLIVMRNGKLKIADFGIARIESSNLTHIGAVMGTPGYMAPEQYTGAQVDWRVDIFSAGVVLYELLTGAKPFVGRVEAVAYKVCHENPPPPSQVACDPAAPPTYDAIIARAISKSPEQRYQSAAQFRSALLEAHAAPVRGTLSEETILTEVVSTLRVEPTNPLSASSAPVSTTARTTAPPPGWDPVLLRQIENHFARFVGPVAKVLVRRTGRQTLDVDELYAQLASTLDGTDDRNAFLATRRTLTGVAPSTSPPRAPTHSGATRPPVAEDAPLTQERIDAAQRRLLAHMGPIARVLVKRAAAQSSSCQHFYALLAESLPEDERGRFLQELAASSNTGGAR
jgi:serine/threonine-protein kinase